MIFNRWIYTGFGLHEIYNEICKAYGHTETSGGITTLVPTLSPGQSWGAHFGSYGFQGIEPIVLGTDPDETVVSIGCK